MEIGDSAPAFASLLRRARQACGLTQEELAERARLSWRTISDLERGVNLPRRDTMALPAEALALDDTTRTAFEAASRRPIPRSAADEPPESRSSSVPYPRVVPLPTGMLTFLIADVRGYTAYTHRHGDAAGAALATRFAAVAGEAVTAQDGQVVEIRGDEVMAVFTSARNALRAAVDLLRGCTAQTTTDSPLPAGVGLDVGEPISVPGGYRGEVINVAARLCAKAGPGEVLASDAVVSLARRIDGLAYEERGPLELKGLSRPVRTWVVRDQSATSVGEHAQPGSVSDADQLGAGTPHPDSVNPNPGIPPEPAALAAPRSDLALSLPVGGYLGAYRDVEVGRHHPLEATLTSLIHDRVVEVVTLRGLTVVGTGALIAARVGTNEVSAVLRALVHERTEGNPFFTEEILAALLEQGAITRVGADGERGEVERIAVPPSIRSVVGQRVTRLAPGVQELLRMASVLGQEFELDLLVAATLRAPDAAAASAEALAALDRQGYEAYRPRVLRAHAHLLHGQGDSEGALECLQECVTLTRRQGNVIELAMTLTLLAQVARQAGNEPLAHETDIERAAIVARIGPETRGLIWAR